MTTDNLNVHGQDELTGGDSPMVATYCQWCNKEIPHGEKICQKCKDADENRREAEAEDERLGW